VALKPLRGALSEWAPGRGIATDPLHALLEAWPGIVGADVAAHSAPLTLNGNTLTIATRSSAWSQQLQFLSPAILAGVRALPQAAAIERLNFRAGALRRTERRVPGRPSRPRAPAGRAPDQTPAADLAEAFARFRARVTAVRRAAGAACHECGAPMAASDPGSVVCAPCAGAAEGRRASDLQRLIYLAPWLGLEEIRDLLPGVEAPEFERERRRLLQRWWLVLERARHARRLSPSGLERHVASSYVLLQSRLPPDRITPAVVQNLLGPELAALLWPPETG
jgi:hypothetical protein